MEEIQSYVVLDLETTGLLGSSFGPTKITELSMVSVLKKHLNDDKDFSPAGLPRVLNKLTLCFHPQSFIFDRPSEITGLSNEMLEEQTPFNLTSYEIIKNFIFRMPKPVCLIAHNGDRYDFPILQAHIKKLGKSFPDDLLCVDSLSAFRKLEIFKRHPGAGKLDEQAGGTLKESLVGIIPPQSGLSAQVITAETPLVSRTEPEGMSVYFGDEIDFANISLGDLNMDVEMEDAKSVLEAVYGSTPRQNQKSGPSDRRHVNGRNKPVVETQTPPSTPVKRESNRANGRTAVRKQLFTDKTSYKLGSIYKHLKGSDIVNAHSAEGDTLALTECIFAAGSPFHNWAQNNSKKFSTILKAW